MDNTSFKTDLPDHLSNESQDSKATETTIVKEVKEEPKAVPPEHIAITKTIPAHSETKKTDHKNIFLFIMAAVVLILCILASNTIGTYAEEMASIRSVGGTSINEAYFQAHGHIYEGVSQLIIAIGLFMSSILVWMGIKN